MVELLAVTLLLALQAPDAEMEAALHTEQVSGDLQAAVRQYGAIVARSADNRPLAARALFQMAQCQERLGQRDAARASYRRVSSEFADQVETAARARVKLAGWTRSEPGPQNLDFERGALGWSGGPIEVHREGCRNQLGCAVVSGPGRVMQSFNATTYKGKTVRLRAWLRGDTNAQLWLGDQQVVAASAKWTQYEIAREVDGTAPSIQFGVVSTGPGSVWIDGVSFQVVPEAEISAIGTSIQKAYGQRDAAYLQPDNTVLAHHTAVTAVKLMGTAALITARVEYVRSEENRTRSVSYVDTRLDTWVRNGREWELKESKVLATRQVDSTTDAQTAKRAAVELKRTAAPMATIEVGHTFYDLAPFGKAVGDARIVALGEATFGTREFFQIKHRLLEYLVVEKGFTIFAIDVNFLEATKLDNYIQSGEGNPKELLTGMLWPWNTVEALEVVEWMHEFNQAPGTHATLRFASFGIPPASVVIPQVVDYLRQCSPLDAVIAETNYNALLDMESRLGEVYDDTAIRAADKAEVVVRLLDSKREALIQVSSAAAWRDARQAAEMARQNAATRIAGKESSYVNEMKTRNIEWLAKDAYPGEKLVLWGHNALFSLAPGDANKSVGRWLREEFGEQVYVTGFAFHRGELLAIGIQNDSHEGVAKQTIPHTAEANGDSVLSAAGMPVFFLDLHTVPGTSALGRWLAESHSFLEVGALWNRDDPRSNSHVKSMAKSYDGLIFLEEGHAARGL